MRTEIDNPKEITVSGSEPKRAVVISGKQKADPVTVTILKPLARSKDLVRTEVTRRNVYSPNTDRNAWLSLRALSIGGVSLAVLVTTILCGLFFAMPDSASGTLAASNGNSNDRLVKRSPRPPKEPGTFVPFPVRNASPSSTDLGPAYEVVNAMLKPARSRPSTIAAVYQARPHLRRPGLVMSNFVPTTLIIYPENGVIKTRIEPQLTALYKK